MIIRIEESSKKAKIVEQVLGNLPEWFGIEESTKEYIKNSKELVVFTDDKNRGFITLKETSKYTIEIYVIGVLKEYHRKRLGKDLFLVAQNYAKDNNYKFMQVKTIKEGIYKEYDRTIRFYKAMGFLEFECFEELWEKGNPCQIFIKSLY